MENKQIKKSTMLQLQTMVDFMEENAEFARGAPVFGATKFSFDEKWKSLCQKLNSIGPPTRTIVEWKKTWADLKSRTKKKIASNKRSLLETGGGLYRMTSLTVLEQQIDKTLLLSSAAAPVGREYGYPAQSCTSRSDASNSGVSKSAASESIEDCFQLLVETPPRVSKTIAVVTPTRLNSDPIITGRNDTQEASGSKRPPPTANSDEQQPTNFSAKKRKTRTEEQLSLIRRQLRIAEASAASAKEQADALKKLANAAELHAEAAKRQAEAADVQAACTTKLLEAIERMEKHVQSVSLNLK